MNSSEARFFPLLNFVLSLAFFFWRWSLQSNRDNARGVYSTDYCVRQRFVFVYIHFSRCTDCRSGPIVPQINMKSSLIHKTTIIFGLDRRHLFSLTNKIHCSRCSLIVTSQLLYNLSVRVTSNSLQPPPCPLFNPFFN